MESTPLSVSEAIVLINQTLEYAYPVLVVEGEVSSYKVNQGKWVFFDLKDAEGTLACFMPVFQLRMPLEDGMRVRVLASPKLTAWGKFSLTVRQVAPIGEGSLKRAFELLKTKLEAEGLFAEERKRPLPPLPRHIAVISSTQTAGYADFIRILNERWGGLQVDVAHVQVQGSDAPNQIIRALQYFNGLESLPEILVIIRGGGSADDLSAFNDEPLVRAIAASRIPTVVGVGHETDESLADLAADVRAATPSHAAQIIVPSKQDMLRAVGQDVRRMGTAIEGAVTTAVAEVHSAVSRAWQTLTQRLDGYGEQLSQRRQLLMAYNPAAVLERGYAIVRGDIGVGKQIEIEKETHFIQAEVKNVRKK